MAGMGPAKMDAFDMHGMSVYCYYCVCFPMMAALSSYLYIRPRQRKIKVVFRLSNQSEVCALTLTFFGKFSG